MAPVTVQEKSIKTRKKYQKLGLNSISHQCLTTSKNKKLWFAFPNLEHARNVSLSRKFLQLNYAFSTPGQFTPKQVKYPWTDWYNSLDNLNKQNYLKHQLPKRQLMGLVNRIGTRIDSNVLTRNIMAYGIPEDRATDAANYARMARIPEVERFLCKVKNDNGTLRDTKLNIFPTLNSTDILPSSLGLGMGASQDIPIGQSSATSAASSGISSTSSVPRVGPRSRVLKKGRKSAPQGNSDPGPAPEEHTEKWQMQNWLRPLQKEYFKVEINEIWYNRRFRGKRTDPIAHRQKLTPPVTEILIEILRKAYFRQEWYNVAKAIEGVCKEASTPSHDALGHSRNWIIWNVGFCSILRFETTLDKASAAVQNFARNFHDIFSPPTYPRRLGVEVAIWLTQEGRFLEGINFMEEMNLVNKNPRAAPDKEIIPKDPNNPKKDLIDFLFHLIRAVQLYALYRRDKSLLERGLFSGNETDLHLRAEVALSAFERLLEYSSKCEGEITTFLEQLVELTIKCRSVERAKELLDDVVVQYYGNAFVERVYLKFLDAHFSQQKNDICQTLQIKRKFRFRTNPSHWHHQGRAISGYRQRQLDSIDNVKLAFNRIENPSFSW